MKLTTVLTLSATAPWIIYEKSEYVRILSIATGKAPLIPLDYLQGWAGGCGFIAALNALFLFRSAAALRLVGESRRVSDLHRALRRVRMAWGLMSLSLLLTVVPYAAIVIWHLLEPPQ